MDALLEIAAEKGIPVVEDAAQALGSRYHSAARGATLHAGTMGVLGCFSFFPSKNLGAYGDGGMVVTSDDALADQIRVLRVHGGRAQYRHDVVGWNSRLDALQAAVLEVKLPHLDAWSAARVANADRYDLWLHEAGLVGNGAVRLPRRDPASSHIFNQYTLRAARRDELREHLASRGMGHSIYYPVPLHLQPCFHELGYREGDLPRAEQASREVISLPIFPELTEGQQRAVVDAIVGFYSG